MGGLTWTFTEGVAARIICAARRELRGVEVHIGASNLATIERAVYAIWGLVYRGSDSERSR